MADDNLGNAGIAHLVVAVADDLEAIGVTNIGVLTEGNKASPDNPQRFAGSLNLTESKRLVGEDELSDELTLGPFLHVSAMDTTASSVSTAPSSLTSLPPSEALSDADSTISNESGSPANPSGQLTLSDLLRVASNMGNFTISLVNVILIPAPVTSVIIDKPLPYRVGTHGVSEDWVSIEPKILREILQVDYPSATIMDLDRVLTMIRNDAVGRINNHESVTMQPDEGDAEEAPTMDPPEQLFA